MTVSRENEKRMVESIARGDRKAMCDLYERYATPLYRFALVRLGEAGAAEDVVQETMLGAWRGAAGFRGQSHVATWLFSICRNKIADVSRSPGAARALTVAPEDLSGHVGQAPQAGEGLHFWEAFTVLSESDQELILLVFYYGFSQKEVAGMLDIPLGTVKSRVFKARRRLREALEGEVADV